MKKRSTPDIRQRFGFAVKTRREELGLTQEEFADKAGIHRTYVSSIELGKVQVGIGVAYKLSQALGVPLSEIWREIEQELRGEGADQTADS